MSSKPGGSKSVNKNQKSSLVPPVLREVGKLAAGVASVSTGSATGNSRNKYALAPGHSLMDWIRLGASGKDLTGVGSQAGRLAVTPGELALHNKEDDAWLCIRGRVYNVTEYLPFHPGGAEQLMKGAGKNATAMFEEVHPWVNYDQILSKCYVGPLKTFVEFDPEELFKSPKAEDLKPLAVTPLKEESPKDPPPSREPVQLPKFDWIQRLDFITLIFYTGTLSNPLVEAARVDDRAVNVTLSYEGSLFENEATFAERVEWPCRTKVSYETGKVEMTFRKLESRIWENFGVLRQRTRFSGGSLLEVKVKCKVVDKLRVNYNTVLVEMERNDGNKCVVPLGKHVRIYETIKGQEVIRSYTPVPKTLFSKFRDFAQTTDTVCLMVKRYPEGNLSQVLSDCLTGDTITISKPLGSFDLQKIEKRVTFILLAAGTGITPMLPIILFLLERRIRKCQQLRLLFFNRTPDDILFRTQFADLEQEEPRFKIFNVLSQADASWTGPRGHISRSLLEESVTEHIADTTYVQSDVFFMVCGPTIFTTLSQQIFRDLGFGEEQIHFFLG